MDKLIFVVQWNMITAVVIESDKESALDRIIGKHSRRKGYENSLERMDAIVTRIGRAESDEEFMNAEYGIVCVSEG